MSPKTSKLFIAIFILALLLRMGLTLVNREAIDDHMEVVRLILSTQQLPSLADCRECFHPKLFYASAAALLGLLGIHDNNAQMVLVQLVNFLAGAITLVFAWKLIEEFPSRNDIVKLITFALLALNPKLIAVNSQATNDSFVILFCTAALFFAWRFLQRPGRMLFGTVVLFLLLAVSTKTTGWIAFAAIFLAFLLAAWAKKEQRKTFLFYVSFMTVCVLALTTFDPLSQFISNFQTYGSPITNTRPAMPMPDFFKQTTSYKGYYFRPGIVSIQDGFLTFKITDLLQYPLVGTEKNDVASYPPQRTSFWTLLYADSQSLHFQNWPRSWETSGTQGFDLSRGIFILGLLPVFIFIVGFFLETFIFLRGLFSHDLHSAYHGLWLAAASGCILFLLLFALLFRDFSFIKFVYILPGLPAFAWLFLRGAEGIYGYLSRSRWAVLLFNSAIVALLTLYVLDVTSLIIQLYQINIQL